MEKKQEKDPPWKINIEAKKDEIYKRLFSSIYTKEICHIAVCFLASPYYTMKLFDEYPNAKLTIIDTKKVRFLYEPFEQSKKCNIIYIEDYVQQSEEIFEKLGMKFDCIVMNPPYSKNLHLKVLAEAIKHLKDDESVCVNLSPVRWLQDPLARYKKVSDLKRFEESVAKHIESLDVLTSNMAQELFKIGMQTDIGIYKCRKSATYTVPNLVDTITAKAAKYYSEHIPKFDKAKYDGWRVRIPTIIGGKSNDGHGRVKSSTDTRISIGNLYCFFDGKKDGKFWYDWYNRNQYTKTTREITCSISFDSETEAENFIKQFNTDFIGFVSQSIWSDVHIAPDKVFWMGDAVNPRTGLKGYLGEWTDEDFYRYFELTDDEVKTVKNMMAKYK